MTRRDFELIADAVRRANNGGPEAERVAASLAAALATRNPFFDRARFMTACGCNRRLDDTGRELTCASQQSSG
jgi:hypothetical protein